MLTGEYIDGENCIGSVISESELTMVVREKLCIHLWISISLFSNAYCCFVEEWREYHFYRPYSAHGRSENNAASNQEM